jgi:hypothetical protein
MLKLRCEMETEKIIIIFILTGICSVIGNSLAIVPARSHEFVSVTRERKSSPQKYPHIVPAYYVHNTHNKWNEMSERDGKLVR